MILSVILRSVFVVTSTSAGFIYASHAVSAVPKHEVYSLPDHSAEYPLFRSRFMSTTVAAISVMTAFGRRDAPLSVTERSVSFSLNLPDATRFPKEDKAVIMFSNSDNGKDLMFADLSDNECADNRILIPFDVMCKTEVGNVRAFNLEIITEDPPGRCLTSEAAVRFLEAHGWKESEVHQQPFNINGPTDLQVRQVTELVRDDNVWIIYPPADRECAWRFQIFELQGAGGTRSTNK